MKIENLSRFLKKRYNLVILCALLLVGVFFAFHGYPLRYNLNDEQVREAVVGIEGARIHQAPLMGAFSSAGPFVWGPWFYYQMIIASLVIPLFYAPWIYLGLLYLGSIALLYKIGEYIQDKDLGLILATLGTFSPALIIGTTDLTFPNALTFFSLLSVLLFIKIVKGNVSYWWGFLFGLILGIGINIHFQTASLGVLPVLMLFYKKKKVIYFLSFCAGFAFTFIPLLLFDLTNHWFDTKNILYFYMFGKNAIYVPNRWLFYVRDFWPSYWADVIGVSKILGLIMMIASGFLVIYQLFKRKLPKPLLLVSIALLIEFIGLRYYWGERFYGYFVFLRPFVLIFTGYIFYFIYKQIKHGKYICLALMLVLIAIVLPMSFDRFKDDPFTVQINKQVKILENKYPNTKFSLYVCSDSYHGNDAKLPMSTVFLLERDGRFSDNGMRIGAEKFRCSGKGTPTKKLALNKLMYKKGHFEEVPETSFSNFSEATPGALKKAGWNPITFRTIYDSTTRWWFREQP